MRQLLASVSILILALILTPLMALTMDEPLQVIQSLPSGKLEGYSGKKEITIMFSKPMAALEAIPAKQPQLFSISPALPGKFRWKDNKTAVFVPDIPLPNATLFTVTIPTTLKALDGTGLLQPYTWTFETQRPMVNYSSLQYENKSVDIAQKFSINFNQPVDPETVKPFIKMVSTNNNTEIPCNITRTKENEKQTIQVAPVNRLEKSTQYKMIISQGLTGIEGPLPMEGTKEIDFSTYGDFRYYGVSQMKDLNPEDALSFEFSNPIDNNDREILKTMVAIEPYAELRSVWSYGNNLSLRYDLKSQTDYKVTIKGGIKDRFGQTLGKDVIITFKTGHRESRVGFKEGIGVIESYLDKKVSIDLVNVQSLDIRKKQLSFEDVITSYRGLYNSTYLNTLKWDISANVSTNSSDDRKNVFPIDLSDVIKGNSGMALISIKPHGNNFRYEPQTYEGVYNVTNIGITGKFSPYSGLLWITRLKDSTPVSAAQVEIRSEAMPSKILWQGVSDNNGFVRIPGRIELEAGDNLWVFVRHSEGVAFVSSGWDWGIQPYRFGYDEDSSSFAYIPKELDSDIFTERGLYKPGDEVQIKGIIREKQDKEWMIPKKITGGKLTVYEYSYDDGGEKVVYSDSVTLSAFGSFNRSFKLKDEIPAYNTLYIKFVPDSKNEQWRNLNTMITSFKVATFRPVGFKVGVRPMQDEYTKGDDVVAKVSGNYLFGAPLNNSDVSWSISQTTAYFAPPGHDGFIFGSYYYDYYDNTQGSTGGTISGSGKLDKDGNYDIISNLGSPSTKQAIRATIEAKVSDESKQEVSGRSSILIHPGEFYIGLKAQKTFIKENDDYPVEVISAVPKGDMISGANIKVSLIKREWKSARKLSADGEYEWVSEMKDTVTEEKDIISASSSVNVKFRPSKAGFYIIKATSKDKGGRDILTTSYLYVSGSSYTGWYMGENDDKVELVSDKENYEPGETAKILIKSPYQEVDALITIEREGVISQWVTKLHGSADSIEVPIKNTYLPNVYVSVILIKGRIGMNMFNEAKQDIGKPSFKIGYVMLPVSPKEKKLNVVIKPSAQTYKPGSDVNIDIQVSDINGKGVASEVTLAAVDEGVLNLINYTLPDPFGIFYATRPLSVSTSETRHHIIGQRVYGEKGGEGGGGDGDYQNLSYSLSDIRKDFRFTAFWLPSLITDSSGKANLSFKLPDSLTSYKIMAVANTLNSSFGSGNTVVKTKKPLMLTPVLPRFMRVNDEINAGVLVYNYSDKPMNITLQAFSKDVLIKGETTGKYIINPGEKQLVRYTYSAPRYAASASVTFVAKSDTNESDAMSVTLPVVKSNPKEIVAFFGHTKESAAEKVKIPDNEGTLSVSMMSTALSGLSGTVEYLFEYPYGCLEQTTSRMLPIILFGDVVNSFNLPTVPGGKYRQAVQENMPKIKLYQRYDGSFGLWQGSNYSDPYLSVYTVFMLIEAKKHGYSIDEGVLNKGLEYVGSIMKQSSIYPYSEYELNTVKSFALYVLTDTGRYDNSYAQYLYEKRASLPFFARAYLLMAIAEGKGPDHMKAELRKELLNGLVYEGGIAHIEEPSQYNSYWLFSSNARSTAAVLMAIMRSSGNTPSTVSSSLPTQSFGKKIMDNIAKVPFVNKLIKKDEAIAKPAGSQADDTVVISMVRWLSEKAKGGVWRSTQENLFVFWALGTYSQMYETEKPDFTANINMGGKITHNAKFAGRSLSVNKKEASLSLFKPDETIDTKINKTGTGTLFYKLQMDYIPKGILPPLDEGIRVTKSYYTLDGKPVVNGIFNLGETYKVNVSLTTSHDRSYVVMESLLASGFEPVNTSFATENQGAAASINEGEGENEMYGWWYSPFNKSEMWDDRMVVFSNYLPTGTHTYSYLVKATIPGRFYIPPDHAEMMYYPEIFGRTSGSNIEIK